MVSQTAILPKSLRFLNTSVFIWFVTVVIGQILFSLYIMGVYGVSGVAGDFERWNTVTPHGYVEKDLAGNLFFGIHILLAFVITVGGPLQLIKKVRETFPKFHRFNGRVYIFSAFFISIAGLYLSWVRGSVGGVIGAVFITINALLIMICAFYTISYAIQHKLKIHRKWALRLFLAVSGVWFFRVFLMLWFAIHQGPVGIDMDAFQGPALNFLYTLSYICPVFCVEFYFRLKESGNKRGLLLLTAFTIILTLCTAVGSLAAAVGLWLPNI